MSPTKRKQKEIYEDKYTTLLVPNKIPINNKNEKSNRDKMIKTDMKLEIRNIEDLRQKQRSQESIIANEEATVLNQQALLLFTLGDFDEAELLLKEALRFSCVISTIGQSNDEEKSFNKSSNTSLNNHNRVSSIILKTSNMNTISNRLIHEYDEGMNLLSTPIEIDTTRKYDDTLKPAALQYNIGLTYIHRRNYLVGIDWFHSAMQVYTHMGEPILHNDNIVIILKIIDALAYSYYRTELYDDAIKFYEAAQKYITNDTSLILDDYLAYVKNSLAVVWFRKEAADALETSKSNSTDNTTVAQLIHHGTGLPITTPKKSIELFSESLTLYKDIFAASKCTKQKSSTECSMLTRTATVYNNLGRAYYLNGNFQQALVCFELALSERRIFLGTSSIDLAVTICNLGQTHHHLEQFDEALSYFNEFLSLADCAIINDDSNNSDSQQNNTFVSHRDVTVVVSSVASIHLRRNQLEEAKKMYGLALKSSRVAFGSIHTEVAHILNKLGSICYKLRQYDMALTHLKEGLLLEQKIYGGKHPNLVVTLMNIAQIYRDQNMNKKALSYYGQAHRLSSAIKGRESMDTCDALLSMGLMLYRMKSFSSAFDYYQEALYVQRKYYGEDTDHVVIASTLNSLAIVVFHSGQVKLAITYFEESLRMRRQLFGEYHPDIAVNLFNLAKLYLELQDTEKASQLYKQTLNVERATHGRLSDEVLQTLQLLGLLYQHNGELMLALKYFSEALELEREKYKETKSPCGAKLLALIGNIHLQRGNVKEMMKCFVDASYICDGNIDSVAVAGHNFYSISKMHPECAETA